MQAVPARPEADRDLRRLARILFRDAYARGITPARAAQLADEAFALLERHVDEVLRLRVRVDAVMCGDASVFEIDAARDTHAFRLFQHGVREIDIHTGIERSELADLLAVFGTDWESAQHLEDDLVTLLGGMELASVQLMVVETFVESHEGDHETIRGVVEAGLSAVPGAGEDLDAAQALVRLWEADLELVEDGVMDLLSPRLRSRGAGATAADLSPSATPFSAALRAAVERPGAGLIAPALTISEVCDGAERERLRDALAFQLASDAAASDDPAAALEAVLLARDRARRPGVDLARLDDLLAPSLERLAVGALGAAPEVVARAVEVLGAASGTQPELIDHVARLAPSEARDRALRALAEHTPGVAPRLQAILPHLDAVGACAALDGLRAAPLEADTLALFRAALASEHARVRARGLGWLNWNAPDHTVRLLGERLRGEDRVLRLASLWLVLRTRPEIARALVTSWLGSDEVEALDFPERCLATLAWVQVVGEAAREPLRETLGASTLFRRRAKHAQGAAIAGLGALGDVASLPAIRKLAKRGDDDPVGAQAMRVAAAFDAGEKPYASAEALVRAELEELGVLGDLRASEPREGRPLTQPPPRRRADSLSSFAVRSSALSTAPPAYLSGPPASAPELARSVDLPLPDLDLAEPSSAALRAPRSPSSPLVETAPAAAPERPRRPPPSGLGLRPPSAPPALREEVIAPSRRPGHPPPSDAPLPGFRAPSRPPEVEAPKIRPPSRAPGADRPGFRPPSDVPPKPTPRIPAPIVETIAGVKPPRLLRRKPEAPAPTAEADLNEMESLLAAFAAEKEGHDG